MNKEFNIKHQLDLYLDRVGLKLSEMSQMQVQETTRAFIGAWGQLLLLTADTSFSEKEREIGYDMMVQQVAFFWEKEINRNERVYPDAPARDTIDISIKITLKENGKMKIQTELPANGNAAVICQQLISIGDTIMHSINDHISNVRIEDEEQMREYVKNLTLGDLGKQ